MGRAYYTWHIFIYSLYIIFFSFLILIEAGRLAQLV